MLRLFEERNAARTMPSAMPTRQAHKPMRQAKDFRSNSMGQHGWSGACATRRAAATKRIHPETTGKRASRATQLVTGGSMSGEGIGNSGEKEGQGHFEGGTAWWFVAVQLAVAQIDQPRADASCDGALGCRRRGAAPVPSARRRGEKDRVPPVVSAGAAKRAAGCGHEPHEALAG